MESQPQSNSIPNLIKLALIVSVFGLTFPIYGVPLSSFKLTFFRLGNAALFCLSLPYGFKIKTKDARVIMLLFVTLAALRIISLLLTDDRQKGIQQIVWFVEGIVFLLSLVFLASHFMDVSRFYLHVLFYLGAVSIVLMVVQFVLLFFGKTWTLPFSESVFGADPNSLPYRDTYPLAGGQIIGAFFEPNMSGSMCAFFMATFLPFLFIHNRPHLRRYIPILLITLIALIATGSRQSALSVALTMSVCSLYSLKKKQIRLLMFIGILCSVFWIGKLISEESNLTRFKLRPDTIFTRYARWEKRGMITGGRWDNVQNAVANLDGETVLFGIGEGRSLFGIHNAYVIVLIENGIIALTLLVSLSIALILKPFRRIARCNDENSFAWGLAGLCIALTWAVLLFANFAQLNQNISYLYLPIPLLFLNNFHYPATGMGQADIICEHEPA